jgi:hypothetical protein
MRTPAAFAGFYTPVENELAFTVWAIIIPTFFRVAYVYEIAVFIYGDWM